MRLSVVDDDFAEDDDEDDEMISVAFCAGLDQEEQFTLKM